MAESKKCFTFFWKIKNFSFCFGKTTSPPFFVKEMGGTKWELILYPLSNTYPSCVAIYFKRCGVDNGLDQIQLDVELAFIDGDGLVLKSEILLKKIYTKLDPNLGLVLYEKKEEIDLLKKDMFIPDDTLTIRCRMWDSQESATQLGRCFAETRIEIDCSTFVGHIKNFSRTKPNSKNLVCFQSSSTISFLSSMNLDIASDGKLVVEMKLATWNISYLYIFKICIRDIFGNKLKSGQSEFRDSMTHTIILTHSKEYLIGNKSDYLPNDALTIECEVTFPTGQTTEKVDEPEFGFDLQESQKITNTIKTNISPNENIAGNLTTLMDDMTLLLNEGILYDTKLITKTETFPAHKLVLSARSSVFKSMFSTDMKEKTNNCVNIDDLDADTVRQMLLFMYSDTFEDLNHESAKSLYFASDKYNIFSLRYKCSSILKQKLSESNCCDLLLLADKHQDRDFKEAVQVYIAKNDKVVLFSDDWKDLEKNNPQLTIEVLRTLYVKCRRI